MRQQLKLSKPKSVVYAIVAVAVVALASLASAPLAHAQPTVANGPVFFIFLQGIDSSLDASTIAGKTTPGFEAIQSAVTTVMPKAKFLSYSYAGPKSKTNPKPQPYDCAPTIENPLNLDAKVLDKQVQAIVTQHPRAQIYLVGHSLGGVVAYAYLAALTETDKFTPLPNANLKGVITLDSPIGGVSGDNPYFSDLTAYYEATCSSAVGQLPSALLDLVTLFGSPSVSSTGSTNPRGSGATVLALPGFHNGLDMPLYPPNQFIANDAFDSVGTRTLTIGNWNDMLWDPTLCGYSTNHFTSTQWMVDEEFGPTVRGVYGRTITEGDTSVCAPAGIPLGLPGLLLNKGNHFDVLTNADVLQGIQQFLNGQAPDALQRSFAES